MRKEFEVLKEKDILERISHENIVKLHEYFTDQTHIFMVLDYLDCDLFEVVKKMGFPEERALWHLSQVMCGLSFLH